MIRISRGNIASKRKKQYFKFCKGYRKSNSRLSTMAMEQRRQSLYFAYISRRLKKRYFRCFWISRIKAALIPYNLKYSKFLEFLKKQKIFLTKKILSFICYNEPIIFYLLIEKYKYKINKLF